MKKMKSLIVTLTIMLVALLAIMPTVSFAEDSYTITINGDVGGRTLKVLQLFDLEILNEGEENEQYVYTWANDFVSTYFSTKLSITSVDAAVEYLSDLSDTQLIEFANNYYTENSSSASTTTVTTGAKSVDITVSSLGYYLIYDATTGLEEGHEQSATVLLNVVSDKTIVSLKANVVEIEKTVDATSANVGDTVNFTLKSVVPDTTQYNTYSFVVTDTMSNGLDYVKDSVAITINAENITVNTDYTVNYEDHVLTITFGNSVDAKTLFGKYTAGDTIYITYSATLNSTAAKTIENSNSAKITYSNDPTSSSTGTSTTEEVYVYSFSINLTKKNAAGTALQGAKFVLKRVSDGKYLAVAGDGTVSWVDSESDATEFTTDDDGEVSITGIEAGEYALVETEAPEGYILPEDNSEFTIKVDASNDDNVATLTSTNVYLNVTDGTITTADVSAFEMTVLNNTNKDLLPETGGIGTTIFKIVGIAVMAIAVIALLVYNKRKNKNKTL